MAFVGRRHTLLVHFPIALARAAAGTEVATSVSAGDRRRTWPFATCAAALPGIFGGVLVWGADFLRP